MNRRLLVVTPMCLALAACATPAPSDLGPAARIGSSRSDGAYTLRLDLPKATWAVGEDLTGTGSLMVEPGAPDTVSGSGGLLGFSFSEVGGRRVLGPGFTADCATHALTPAGPIVTPLTKSGGWADDQPDADFYRQFFTQPGIRLPAGDWDVAVETTFYEGGGCSGPSHDLKATVRVHVTDEPPPSPQP